MIIPCNMPKIVYAADVMYKKRSIKAESIYMVPIYMYARLGLGVYSPSTYIYIYIAHIYIYST